VRALTEEVLLRVFVGEEDRYRGRHLYEAIVAEALASKMAGATVLPCLEGFGRSRHIRTELDVDSGSCLPMVVEIVDRAEEIDRFLLQLHDMVESGLISMEKVRAIHYSPGNRRSPIATPPSSTDPA
jgi:uncharacterized protein